MIGNTKLSERLAVLAAINPTTLTTTATAATSSYVQLTATNGNLPQRYIAIVNTGDNGTGSVTVNLLKASDTSGTGATAVSTTSLSATNGDNRQVIIDLAAVTVDTSKPYIAVQATIDSGTCPVAGLLIGGDVRYLSATSIDASSVSVV